MQLDGSTGDGAKSQSRLTDLDLHLTPVLVELLLELGGLLEVALQLATCDDQPEGNEHNDAAQHNGVDQPCQHGVHKPASIAGGNHVMIWNTDLRRSTHRASDAATLHEQMSQK